MAAVEDRPSASGSDILWPSDKPPSWGKRIPEGYSTYWGYYEKIIQKPEVKGTGKWDFTAPEREGNFLSKWALLPSLNDLTIHDPIRYPNERQADVEYHLRYIEPLVNHWGADFSSNLMSTQRNKICGPLEVRALECIDYYGTKKGLEICKDYYDDFIECCRETKQKLRWQAMYLQRRKRWFEWLRGERDYDTVYEPPPKPHAWKEPGNLRTKTFIY